MHSLLEHFVPVTNSLRVTIIPLLLSKLLLAVCKPIFSKNIYTYTWRVCLSIIIPINEVIQKSLSLAPAI